MTTAILKSHLTFLCVWGEDYILSGRMIKRLHMCHIKGIGLISVMGKIASGEEGSFRMHSLSTKRHLKNNFRGKKLSVFNSELALCLSQHLPDWSHTYGNETALQQFQTHGMDSLKGACLSFSIEQSIALPNCIKPKKPSESRKDLSSDPESSLQSTKEGIIKKSRERETLLEYFHFFNPS